MVSSGVRETIRYLCQHKMVDCVVTTAGGIEEDIMKCIRPHQVSDQHQQQEEETSAITGWQWQ
jgi:deoxyhypusine synthase